MIHGIGLDPGSRSPAHVLCKGSASAATSAVPIKKVDYVPVFFEDQYPGTKSSRQSLMTLSRYGGIHAGAYLAWGHVVYVLPPELWRETVLPRSRALPKHVLHSRLETPAEVSKKGPDFVDAYWICQAGLALLDRNYPLERLDWLK